MHKTDNRLRMLLLAALALTPLAWGLQTVLFGGGESMPLLASTLPFSQLGILAVVLILGPGRPLVRLPLVLLAAAGGLLTCFASWPSGDSMLWLIAMVEASTIVVAVLAIRLLGGRIRLVDFPAAQMPLMRFSIRGLLVLTVSSAVVITISRCLNTLARSQPTVPQWMIVILLGIGLAAISVLGATMLLQRGPVYMRAVCFAISVLAIGWCIPVVVDHAADAVAFATWLSIHAGIISVALLAFRGAGFRLFRPGRQPQEKPARRDLAAVTPSPPTPTRVHWKGACDA